MAEARDGRWLEVINLIDKEGERMAFQQEFEESLRKKAYHSLIDGECNERKHHRLQSLRQKHKQKEVVDLKAKEEQQERQQQRQQRMQIEKQFGDDNRQLFRHKRNNTEAAQEHPFIKLVEEEERRKGLVKEHFLMQNKVNQLQSDMHKNSSELERKRASQQRQAYVNHIEEVFKKRDREQAERRLKYSWNRQSTNSQNPELEQRQMHRIYLRELQTDLEKKSLRRIHTDNSMNTFQELVSYNPEVVHSMSPAMLGKLPFSHDRKRQLEIINKKLGLDRQRLRQANLHSIDTSALNKPTFNKQFNEFKEFLSPTELHNGHFPKTSANIQQRDTRLRQHLKHTSESRSVAEVRPEDQPTPKRASPEKSVQLPRIEPPMSRPKTIRTFKTFNILTGSPQNIRVEL